MKRRILTLLAVLAVLVGALAVVGQAATAETLNGNVDSKTITEDTELVMAGYSIGTLTVEKGVTVTLKGMGNGTIGSIEGEGTVVITDTKTTQVKIDNKTYSVEVNYLNFADGGQLILGTAGINLSTDPEDVSLYGASVYYTSVFGGNAKVQAKVAAYGVALGAGRAPNFADKTYTRTDSSWTVSDVEAFAGNGVRLTNIMNTNKAYSLNKMGATKKIYNVAYVELATGTRITSDSKNICLKDTVEAITADEVNPNTGNVVWDDYSYLSKSWIVQFCETFENVVSAWDLGRLDAYLNDGTYELHTASDIRMMADNPNASYALMADIDMSRMEAINGLVGFTGSIDGNGHTITGLSVNGIALVDTVAAGQSVTDLHLRDVNVVVPAKSAALNVGMIAGTNNGSVTGVTVEGTLKDTRAGAEGKEIYAGAIVGKNSGTVSVGNTISVSNARDAEGNLKQSITNESGLVNVTENDLTVTGLSADVGLFMDETSDYVNRGLIGTGTAVSNAANVYWRDRSYSTERQAAELQRRRQIVVDDVFEQGTIKWTPATTIKYWNDQTNNPNMEKPSGWLDQIVSGKWHIHNQTFNPGTTYYGVPYTHCASPLEQAKYYMTEGTNGVYTLKSEVTQIKGGKDDKAGESTWTGNGGANKIGWGKYFGSDCSGGLTGAWHKVSPIITSNKDNNGVCLFYTTNMVPSQYNQWYYGFKQVGDYEVDDATWSGGTAGEPVTAGKVTMTDYVMDTDDIMAKIGAEGFYDAYAQSQMGDIVVAYSRTGLVGHARMIADDPVVIRNGNNAIDSAKSYFLFHEQGAGLYTSPGVSSWRVNWKCSFAEAAMQQNGQEMGGNGVGYYLPITMPAFHNTKVAATGGIATGGNVITGNDPIKYALNSSYRIMSATMIIKDEQGNTVYEATRFQGTSSSQNRRRAVPGSIPLFASDIFSDCCDDLVEGQTYYVTFSGTTYTGVTNVKMDNYKIVYDPAA